MNIFLCIEAFLVEFLDAVGGVPAKVLRVIE